LSAYEEHLGDTWGSGMTQNIDSARLTLILNEIRSLVIKQDWAAFAERADERTGKVGPPPAS
jgi:hypothetical protein